MGRVTDFKICKTILRNRAILQSLYPYHFDVLIKESNRSHVEYLWIVGIVILVRVRYVVVLVGGIGGIDLWVLGSGGYKVFKLLMDFGRWIWS